MLHSKTLTSPPRSPMQTRPSHPRSTSILLTPSWNALLRIRSKIVPTKKPPWCIEPLCSANIAPHRKQRHPHAPLPMLLSSCRTMTFRCLLAQDLGDAGIALPRPTHRVWHFSHSLFYSGGPASPVLQAQGLRRTAGGSRSVIANQKRSSLLLTRNANTYIALTQVTTCVRVPRSCFHVFASCT